MTKRLLILLLLAVVCAMATITPASVSPYTGQNGWLTVYFGNNTGAAQCEVRANILTGEVRLMAPGGFYSSGGLGTQGTMSNANCLINKQTSWQYQDGNGHAWFAPDMTFFSPMYNQFYVWSGAIDSFASFTGWFNVGGWNGTPFTGPPTVTVTSQAIGTSGVQIRYTVTATGYDQGWTALEIAAGGAGWAGWNHPGCNWLFNPNGTMQIGNDTQSAWGTPVTMGTQSSDPYNANCTGNAVTAQHTFSGNTHTYAVTVIAYPGFSGTKQINALSSTSGGAYGTPAYFGDWNIDPNAYGSELVVLPVAGGYMQDDDYLGGQSMSDTSAGILTVRRKDSRKVLFTTPHAGNIKMRKAVYSVGKDLDAIKYTYHFDLTGGVNFIRMGALWDNAFAHDNANGFQDIGHTVSPNSAPAGWVGDGTGWVALAELTDEYKIQPVKTEDAEFSVSSHHKPGLFPVYFMDKNWRFPIPTTGDRATDLAISRGTTYMHNSHIEYVIGPAFPMDVTKDQVIETVGHWVNTYGFSFLAPFLVEGKLDGVTPEGDFEKELVDCILAVLPKQ